MSDSNIEWTDKTWNPTTGCEKVSEECRFCYAMFMAWRLQHNPKIKHRYEGTTKKMANGEVNWTGKINMIEEILNYPFSIKKPQRIFIDSMSDLFHKDVTVEFIAKVYAIMFLAKQHTYQILTKRPDRREQVLKSDEFFEYLWKYCNKFHDDYIQYIEEEMYQHDEIKSLFPFKNIWEGTSVGMANAKPRIDFLRNTPATYRFISAEPMLEDLGELNLTGINQIIAGGESGHKKRPFNCDWARSVRDQAKQQGIAFFMKQVDKVQEIPEDLMIREY